MTSQKLTRKTNKHTWYYFSDGPYAERRASVTRFGVCLLDGRIGSLNGFEKRMDRAGLLKPIRLRTVTITRVHSK